MTTIDEKINKLETLLAQVPKETPTYTTIKRQLDELVAERDKAKAKATPPTPRLFRASLRILLSLDFRLLIGGIQPMKIFPSTSFIYGEFGSLSHNIAAL